MVWKSTLRPAFSLFPDNTPECWALEKYYLSHKKSLIWLFLMETFRPQTMTTVPKLQIIWAISSSKKNQLSTARPKCLMWRVPPSGNCHWFQSIRCKMLLFELCFRTCTWSFVLETEHPWEQWHPGEGMDSPKSHCCNLGLYICIHLECSPVLSPSLPHTSSQDSAAALPKLELFCNWH